MRAEKYVELYTDLAELLCREIRINRNSKRGKDEQLTDEEEQDLFIDCCQEVEDILFSYGIKPKHVKKEKGFRYVFNQVPNDAKGKQFVKDCRTYLNKYGYTMRVKGQYLDKSKLPPGKSWKDFQDGQPLKYSKSIRVYFDREIEHLW